jgi:hypothetical protein
MAEVQGCPGSSEGMIVHGRRECRYATTDTAHHADALLDFVSYNEVDSKRFISSISSAQCSNQLFNQEQSSFSASVSISRAVKGQIGPVQ